MADAKFYRCGAPRAPRSWSWGDPMKFTVIDLNTGVLATDNPAMQRDLDQAIANQNMGIFAITREEYFSLKKNQNSNQPWREELSGRGIERNKAPLRDQPSPPPELTQARQALADLDDAAGDEGAAPMSVTNPKPPPPTRPKASKRA